MCPVWSSGQTQWEGEIWVILENAHSLSCLPFREECLEQSGCRVEVTPGCPEVRDRPPAL